MLYLRIIWGVLFDLALFDIYLRDLRRSGVFYSIAWFLAFHADGNYLMHDNGVNVIVRY